MTPLAFIILLIWPLIVAALCAIMPGRRAAAIAVIGGWLLLPPYVLVLSGLPDYSKSMAAAVGMLIGTLLFFPNRMVGFRPRWIDLPMLVWCFSGVPSYLSNGLTLYDGLSDSLTQIVYWGLPYLIGRLYFDTLDDLRYFAGAMAIGGIAYILPCLYEIRMSPQLLGNFYGASGWQGMRLGGYRPRVFFATGLECGLWMSAASLAAWWLWKTGALRRLGGYPFGPAMAALLVTNVLCRSTGALVLFLAGTAALWLTAAFRTRLIVAALLLVGPVYVGVRSTNVWSGDQAVNLAESVIGWDRAESLQYRFKCERRLSAHALERPWLGWSGFGRNTAFFDAEQRVPVPIDGLWILVLGTKGFVGLVALYLALILPAARVVRLAPAAAWGDPRMAGAAIGAVLLGLYMVDCLMNGFINMSYIALAGGLASLGERELRRRGPLTAAAAVAAEPRAMAAVAPTSGPERLAGRCRALGRSYKREGRPDEADAAWRQALDWLAAAVAADPAADRPRRLWCDCANDLAWLQANRPDPARRDPAAAAAMARRAVDEYPDVAAYWNTLGAAHYRAGDPEAAIEALERSRVLGGGTAFDDVFLAMAHHGAGDPEAARHALARALLLAERDHPGHAELAALLEEAQSLLSCRLPVASFQ